MEPFEIKCFICLKNEPHFTITINTAGLDKDLNIINGGICGYCVNIILAFGYGMNPITNPHGLLKE